MNTAALSVPLPRPVEMRSSLSRFSGAWGHDMAMDLGTANTLIYVKNKGIVLNEPSAVAIEEANSKPVAIGRAAKEMFGKTSRGIRCVRPMKDGVIADFDMTTLMIKYMIGQAVRRWVFSKPRLVIGVPSGITQVEKRAVIDAALCSGVREVKLVEEPMAAALGAGLPVDKAVGNMIVDIGGGTPEVAILTMNATIYSHSIRVAGDVMDETIQRCVKRKYELQIGVMEAERIKLLIGSALPFGKRRTMTVYGRDLVRCLPQKVEVSDEVIREALNEPICAIISSVVTALEQTSPEIAQDIVSRGIYLAGGGALLKGLGERLYRETGIQCHLPHDPLSCVVRGVGKIVDNLKEYKIFCIA